MTLTQTVEIPDTRQITLEVPREIPTGSTARFNIIWFPVKEEPSEMKGREFGCHKGKVWMADDFNEPLEDFKDYM